MKHQTAPGTEERKKENKRAKRKKHRKQIKARKRH